MPRLQAVGVAYPVVANRANLSAVRPLPVANLQVVFLPHRVLVVHQVHLQQAVSLLLNLHCLVPAVNPLVVLLHYPVQVVHLRVRVVVLLLPRWECIGDAAA